jgi:hypothetical protein
MARPVLGGLLIAKAVGEKVAAAPVPVLPVVAERIYRLGCASPGSVRTQCGLHDSRHFLHGLPAMASGRPLASRPLPFDATLIDGVGYDV